MFRIIQTANNKWPQRKARPLDTTLLPAITLLSKYYVIISRHNSGDNNSDDDQKSGRNHGQSRAGRDQRKRHTQRLKLAPNHYDLLGVEADASAKEIKTAFYDKSKQYHPDRNPGDTAAADKFREVNDAYQVLGNEVSKREYDIQHFGSNFGYQRERRRPAVNDWTNGAEDPDDYTLKWRNRQAKRMSEEQEYEKRYTENMFSRDFREHVRSHYDPKMERRISERELEEDRKFYERVDAELSGRYTFLTALFSSICLYFGVRMFCDEFFGWSESEKSDRDRNNDRK